MLTSGLNLVTTVIGFGMSATFIVFVCARLICGRARPAAAAADSSGGGGLRVLDFDIEFLPESGRLADHGRNGLDPVAVAAIPTMKYSHRTFHSIEDAQCSICLADYKEREILRIMPTCHHNFHLLCIDVWLQKHVTCPICRMSLADQSERKSAAETANRPLGAISQQDLYLLPVQDHHAGTGENRLDIDDSYTMSVQIPEEIHAADAA